MPEETQPDIKPAGPPSAPDPEKLKPVGLSNTYKRYIYWGVTAVLALLILANIVGPKQSVRTTAPNPSAPVQKENPSPAQIRDWENSLKQAEAQLEQQQKDRQRQLDAARLMQQKSPLTPEEQLQRAEALSEAAMARQQYVRTEVRQRSRTVWAGTTKITGRKRAGAAGLQVAFRGQRRPAGYEPHLP